MTRFWMAEPDAGIEHRRKVQRRLATAAVFDWTTTLLAAGLLVAAGGLAGVYLGRLDAAAARPALSHPQLTWISYAAPPPR